MIRAAVELAAVVVAVVISRPIGFAAGHCRSGRVPVENRDRRWHVAFLFVVVAVAFVVVLGVVVVLAIILEVVIVIAFAVVVVVVVAVVAVAVVLGAAVERFFLF